MHTLLPIFESKRPRSPRALDRLSLNALHIAMSPLGDVAEFDDTDDNEHTLTLTPAPLSLILASDGGTWTASVADAASLDLVVLARGQSRQEVVCKVLVIIQDRTRAALERLTAGNTGMVDARLSA